MSRKVIQIAVWILLIILTFFLFLLPTAVCWLCPFWYVQHFSSLGSTDLSLFLGASWTPPQLTYLILLGGFILLGLVLGRFFCGWLCPFGSLLETAERLSPFKIKKLPVFLPSYLKYISLLLFLALAFAFQRSMFCIVCPAGFIFKGIAGTVLIPSLLALLAVLALTLFYGWKAWCNSLCPLGGFLGILSRFQVFGIRSKSERCKKCYECREICPTDIDVVSYEGKEIKSPDCLMCMKCIEKCEEELLEFS